MMNESDMKDDAGESPTPTPAGLPKREGERIAKMMARAGLCSRRDAEQWIAGGRVAVNGVTLTSANVVVGPKDRVVVDGAPLATRERTRLFLFHKPRGYVVTDRDPEGRPTIFDILPADLPRVVTIGRLDINTEGLLLLTNDGGLARVLELPATGWLRRYRVRAHGETDQAALDSLAQGVTIDGIDYLGVEATLDRLQGSNVWLTMGLREGKNREVKKLLEHLGLSVNRLIRVSYGPFQLGELTEGAVEEVRGRVLRDQLGAKLAEQAGVDFDAPVVDRSPADEPARRERREPPRREQDESSRRERTLRRGPAGEAPRGRRGDVRPRDGTGPRRRPDARPQSRDEPPPRRERPPAGKRKHVTTLRAERAEAGAEGPRIRTTRGQTADRRGRAVVVERRERVAPPAAAPEAAPARAPRRSAGRDGEAARTRRFAAPDAPGRGGPRPPRREGAPPRGARPPRGDDARQDFRKGGEERRGAGPRPRRFEAADGAPARARDDRPPRREGGPEHSARPPRGEAGRKDFRKGRAEAGRGGPPRGKPFRPREETGERRREAGPGRADRRPGEERRPRFEGPREGRPPRRDDRPPRSDGGAPRGERREGDARPPRGDRPFRSDRAPGERSFGGARGKPGGGKFAGKFGDKPGGRPGGRFGDKPQGRSSGGAPGGKPGGRPGGKPGGRPGGKPGGRPGGGGRPPGGRGPRRD